MPRADRPVIVLGNRRRAKLEKIVARATAPQRLVQRAKIVLLGWQGRSYKEIVAEVGACVDTVRTWIARYSSGGLPALADRPRSGCPEVYGPTVRVGVAARASKVLGDLHAQARQLAEHGRATRSRLRRVEITKEVRLMSKV